MLVGDSTELSGGDCRQDGLDFFFSICVEVNQVVWVEIVALVSDSAAVTVYLGYCFQCQIGTLDLTLAMANAMNWHFAELGFQQLIKLFPI